MNFKILKKMGKDKITKEDLGFVDDAITLIIDLLHVEMHSFRSFEQTRDKTWLEIYNEARIQRTDLLKTICNEDVLNSDGEIWCVNKHSLRAVGSYIELGSRKLSEGDTEKSIYYFDKASQWLGIFLIKNKLKGGENV